MIVRTVILAAGQGTRMRSKLPKVLHPLLGKPMLHYAIDAVQREMDAKPVVVVGHGAQEIQRAFADQALFVIQDPLLGTGHAVQQAEPVLKGQAEAVLVTYGDMPLLTRRTIDCIIAAHAAHTGPITMLTMIEEDPRGFGRVLRDTRGYVTEIVEEAQASPDQLNVRELNPGVYCFSADWLWQALERVPLSPKGEYYLTDTIGIAVADGLSVQAILLDDPAEGIGINTRLHLSEAQAVLQARINRQWMLEGVSIIDPLRTVIEPDARIGEDTIIWPDSYILGSSVVGSGCVLGPNTWVKDSRVGDGCRVFASILEDAVVENRVEIGPYAHLRSGAHLASGVHMGNFGEVKNSYLGSGVKMGHFSYIGDAQIGQDVNIGAGTVTCNFDGVQKNHTEIEAGVFIGSDTMLVAPVKIGEGARTGAGAVVTKDIPPNTLAVGVPARVIRALKKRE
ncbi:MAG: UDP-N-acetylglucosamine diphosphorylase/glucosamine-1-phosphate N-acetyltransferase [Anaerolineae bacterium UTCFX2]|nr:MAG: UDP-N-acetylglucosamine diphosphorylase/glucosamine-1-phosphate N-acetyltransferase [Anaerolineae bacterium UTCFX2]